MSEPIKATVQSIEGDNVHVLLSDGQMIRLSSKYFEGTPKVGAEALLIIAIPGSEDAGRQTMAHHILNQLLGT
jgi:hypothetical protein